MKVIITETRLESVKYYYEYEGTIEQAKEIGILWKIGKL